MNAKTLESVASRSSTFRGTVYIGNSIGASSDSQQRFKVQAEALDFGLTVKGGVCEVWMTQRSPDLAIEK